MKHNRGDEDQIEEQSGNACKRVKIDENEEATKHVIKQYGGLECSVKGILKSVYVTNVAQLDYLDSLPQFNHESPETVFDLEKVRGLKNPTVVVYFTPVRLRGYITMTQEKKAPDFDDLIARVLDHYYEEDHQNMITSDLEVFKEWLNEETQRSDYVGKIINEFETDSGKRFEVRKYSQ